MTDQTEHFSGPGVVVCQGDRTWSVASLQAALVPPEGLQYAQRVALHLPDSAHMVAAIDWLHRSGRRGALLHSELTRNEARQSAFRLGCSYVLSAGSDDIQAWTWEALDGTAASSNWCSSREPGLLLQTSGSTGEPKNVFHSWASLFDSVTVRPDLARSRWMTLYPTTRFAGLNTLLHGLANRAVVIIPTALNPRSIGEHLVSWSPTHLSGTPTLWRTLLMQVPLSGSWRDGILQVTLGGETVDQAILDLLGVTFPQARVTHIYASTEAGVCISVSDGHAGFPSAWLNNADRRVQLSINEGGELLVHRRGPRSIVLEGTDGGWWPTGDLVRIEGDRVFFLGRNSDILNVGGAKVSPAAVEACLAEVAGVAASRVFARKSSIAGTLVAAEVVPAAGAEHTELRRRILQQCRARLAAYAVPRSIEFVTALQIAASGKLERKLN